MLNRIDHSLIGIFFFKLINRVHAGAEPGGAKKKIPSWLPLEQFKILGPKLVKFKSP